MSAAGRTTRLRDLIQQDGAKALVAELMPGLLDNLDSMGAALDLPIGVIVEHGDRFSSATLAQFWLELSQVEMPDKVEHAPIPPNPDYEPDTVERGSAVAQVQDADGVYETVELKFDGPSHGNPFVDVEFSAHFTHGDSSVRVGGFYDGGGTYIVRFLPVSAGTWTFSTESTARSLDGIEGSFRVGDAVPRGPVRVVDSYYFQFSNGEAFVPIGTTAYAWTHQETALERETLDTLANSPFNKIRMGVFPKSYDYNTNEPRFYPFEPIDGGWDFTRFDVRFFHHLENRIRDLQSLNIEADLILFHPYDRWGFAEMGRAADDRYLKYIVRRLAAFPNVWWSLANEFDFLTAKTAEDWERFAKIVEIEDHANHLLSIHNGATLFDYAAPWATHCSIQKIDGYKTTELVTEYRARWSKPIVIDEFGYEGDIEWSWGNISATEMVRRFWEATTRGGYATHGETYWRADDVLFWSKGGSLHGLSADRIAFLARIVAESPTGRLEPMIRGEYPTAGVPEKYEITYFGLNQPRFAFVRVPAGRVAEIDVLDTWAMTAERLSGEHSGTVKVPLPGRSFIAVRVVIAAAE